MLELTVCVWCDVSSILSLIYLIWSNDAHTVSDTLYLMMLNWTHCVCCFCIFYIESDAVSVNVKHCIWSDNDVCDTLYLIKLNLLYCIWCNDAHNVSDYTVSDPLYLMMPNWTHGVWSDHYVCDTMIWLSCKIDTLNLT